MKYKLICTDMDGTLLSNKHEVSNFNKEMIQKAVEKGVKVSITTGRLFASARKYSDMLGINAPIIASNGAYIREKDRDDAIYESALTKKQFTKILNVVKKYDFTVYMNTSDTVICENIVEGSHAYKMMNEELDANYKIKFIEGRPFEEVFDEYEGQILKVICILEDEDKSELFKAKEELVPEEDLEVVSSWANNFEVMPIGTSKGSAVARLAEMYGIKREEVICLGDSENDLSMIEYAGLGIAMGNATDQIKSVANYITDTNAESGVGKAIEKFVINEEEI